MTASSDLKAWEEIAVFRAAGLPVTAASGTQVELPEIAGLASVTPPSAPSAERQFYRIVVKMIR